MSDTPRLTARLQVDALLRRVSAAGGFGAVVARGDETAGAILLLHRGRDGQTTAWQRRFDGRWAAVLGLDDDSVNLASYLERQRRYDPDLWVIELDIPDLTPFIA